MAYIYQITNDVNGKIYIGKTEFSISKRFEEHCADAFRDRSEKRPLYAAMRKYGIEHFHIELIEETDNPNEREIYWIEQKGSFKNGYNATLGGDGKRYLDYDLIVATYNQVQNVTKTAQICNVSVDSVSNILTQRGIAILSPQEINRKKYSKQVGMFDPKTQQLLNSFSSLTEAANFCIKNKISQSTSTNVRGVAAHIGKVCNGKRKQSLGYLWKFI